MVWEKKSVCEKFALNAEICDLDSGFLATDYMSFPLKSRH